MRCWSIIETPDRPSQPFEHELFLVLMGGEFAGDDLLHLLCHSIVCSVVTVSPMADGGLQTGCLSS